MPETDISLWELNRHFSAWTSVNGLPHVILTHSPLLRLIWAVITFGALFGGIYQTGALIVTYFNYAVTLETRASFTLSTPAVWPFHRSLSAIPMPGSSAKWRALRFSLWLDKAKIRIQTFMPFRIAAYNSPGPNGRFNLGWPASERRRLRALHWQWQMGERLAQLAQRNGSQIAYSFTDLVASCRFGQRPCNTSNFIDFFDPYFGHCFTFNQAGLLNSSVAGPSHGLELELRADSADYLPWVDTQAAILSFDIANATPYIDAYGYLARPGRLAKFGVQFMFRQKLPAPFNNCTDSDWDVSSQPIYYGNNYELDACTRSCLQDRIIFLCGCYSPIFNRPINSSHPPAKLSCLDAPNPNWALDCMEGILNFQNNSQWNPTMCDCPKSCDQSYYKISFSEAKWPARNYIPPECASSSSSSLRPRWNGSEERCRQWMAQNSLLVQVFHQRIATVSITESQAYQVIDFIADAGGALGLWLGMSAISIIECFILLAMAFAYCCARPARRARLRPGYDYFASLAKPKANELNRRETEVQIPPRVSEPS